uniref:Uncharacterized protein n=1 Tax=Rhizophagus irregularis (strain DAOM 181602 / DAOM 197198 / MUCL 43194) TaxID=747089 RepID=U9UD15_RHIID
MEIFKFSIIRFLSSNLYGSTVINSIGYYITIIHCCYVDPCGINNSTCLDLGRSCNRFTKFFAIKYYSESNKGEDNGNIMAGTLVREQSNYTVFMTNTRKNINYIRIITIFLCVKQVTKFKQTHKVYPINHL